MEVCENQIVFMPGRSIMDPIFALRQMTEKYRQAQKDESIDQVKAYDRVWRKVFWQSL